LEEEEFSEPNRSLNVSRVHPHFPSSLTFLAFLSISIIQQEQENRREKIQKTTRQTRKAIPTKKDRARCKIAVEIKNHRKDQEKRAEEEHRGVADQGRRETEV